MAPSPKIGLVLSGGGTRGLAQIGVLKVLAKMGFKPDIIAGCSMGAIVGAMMAAGRAPAEMEEFVLQQKVWRLLQWPIGKLGLSNLSKMERELTRFLAVKKFEELTTRLIINSTDMAHAEIVSYDRGPIWPAIRASISIPGLFAPVKNKNRIEVDGGVLNQHPFSLLPKEVTKFILVDTSPEEVVTDKHSSVIYLLQASVAIMQNEITRLRLAAIDPEKYLVIHPNLSGHYLIETEKSFHRLINHGVDAAWALEEKITKIIK